MSEQWPQIESYITAKTGGNQWRQWPMHDYPGNPRRTYAVVASCPYRDEVRRYDIDAESEAEAHTEAARRYGHEPTIGVEPADVVTEGA